jgi:hypothetical protein
MYRPQRGGLEAQFVRTVKISNGGMRQAAVHGKGLPPEAAVNRGARG